MNMSLPIQVFGDDTILQRLSRGYCYAPILMQKANNVTNPAQRLALCAAFSLTFSLAYAQMTKPFNPILGETYQAMVDDCPVYAQQICHHPPITSTYMIGRGYKIHGSFEPKV